MTEPNSDQAPRFPTMLRKMWSGAEVQAWIDENWNRRAPAVPNWQPIETAPKDGSVILLWRYYPIAGKWVDGAEYECEFVALGSAYCQFEKNGAYGEDAAVSHWMPLPPPPEAASQPDSVNEGSAGEVK
jgi:hypothetical protein